MAQVVADRRFFDRVGELIEDGYLLRHDDYRLTRKGVDHLNWLLSNGFIGKHTVTCFSTRALSVLMACADRRAKPRAKQK